MTDIVQRVADQLPDRARLYPRRGSLATLVRAIEQALASGAGHFVSRWLDAERERPSDEDFLTTLDAACEAVAARSTVPRAVVRTTLESVRRSAREQLRCAAVADTIADIERRPRVVVETLLAAMSAHDLATARHMRECGALARRFAIDLGVDAFQAAHIELAATLHDIGKLAVPASVLTTRGRLTPDEWTLVKAHPLRGAEIVSAIEDTAFLAPTILAHHERMDGAGYPYRLPETQIGLEARVVAIVDSWHAMTSQRSYSAPRSPRAAIDELYAGRGTQWDGALIDAFVDTIAERRHLRSA